MWKWDVKHTLIWFPDIKGVTHNKQSTLQFYLQIMNSFRQHESRKHQIFGETRGFNTITILSWKWFLATKQVPLLEQPSHTRHLDLETFTLSFKGSPFVSLEGIPSNVRTILRDFQKMISSNVSRNVRDTGMCVLSQKQSSYFEDDRSPHRLIHKTEVLCISEVT
jgi:hypothetical protein